MRILALWRRWKWQDKVFAIGEVVFMTGLLPSVLSASYKPAPATSITTALMLCAFLFVHASYKLWVAFVLTVATIGLWLTLFLQVTL